MGAEHSHALHALEDLDPQVDQLGSELESMLHDHRHHSDRSRDTPIRKCKLCADRLANFNLRIFDLQAHIDKLAVGDDSSKHAALHSHRPLHERQKLSFHARAVMTQIKHILDIEVYPRFGPGEMTRPLPPYEKVVKAPGEHHHANTRDYALINLTTKGQAARMPRNEPAHHHHQPVEAPPVADHHEAPPSHARVDPYRAHAAVLAMPHPPPVQHHFDYQQNRQNLPWGAAAEPSQGPDSFADDFIPPTNVQHPYCRDPQQFGLPPGVAFPHGPFGASPDYGFDDNGQHTAPFASVGMAPAGFCFGEAAEGYEGDVELDAVDDIDPDPLSSQPGSQLHSPAQQIKLQDQLERAAARAYHHGREAVEQPQHGHHKANDPPAYPPAATTGSAPAKGEVAAAIAEYRHQYAERQHHAHPLENVKGPPTHHGAPVHHAHSPVEHNLKPAPPLYTGTGPLAKPARPVEHEVIDVEALPDIEDEREDVDDLHAEADDGDGAIDANELEARLAHLTTAPGPESDHDTAGPLTFQRTPAQQRRRRSVAPERKHNTSLQIDIGPAFFGSLGIKPNGRGGRGHARIPSNDSSVMASSTRATFGGSQPDLTNEEDEELSEVSPPLQTTERAEDRMPVDDVPMTTTQEGKRLESLRGSAHPRKRTGSLSLQNDRHRHRRTFSLNEKANSEKEEHSTGPKSAEGVNLGPGIKIFFGNGGTERQSTDASRFETLLDDEPPAVLSSKSPLSPTKQGNQHVFDDADVTESPKTARHLSNLYTRPEHPHAEMPVWRK